MRLLLSLPLVALSFFLANVTANPHGSPHARRHDAIARRAPGDVSTHLQKRFDNARWTFYDVGQGACGQFNVASDFIVALNSAQYGGGYPGPYCFQQIVMTYNGKTTTATIMDECPGCPYGGLDLSRGLFDFFASESDGVIYGTWNFAGGDQSTPTTTTSTTPAWTPPSTTSSPTSTSTSTYTPQTSSTTPTWSSSSADPLSQPSSSSGSSSSSPINYSSGPASNLAVPTPATVSDSSPHNLLALNEDIIALGGIVVAGGRV